MTHDALMPIDNSFEDETRIQVPVDMAAPVFLSVTNASGEVRISSSDRNDILITATRTDEGSYDPDDPQKIEVKATGNKISVHPNWQINSTISDIFNKVKSQLKDGFNADDWDFKRLKIGRDLAFDVHIDVPRPLADGSKVAVRVASGDVDASDLHADISITSANGDIELTRLEGKVSAHTTNGDVRVTTINGSLEVNSVSGDVTVDGGEAWTALRAVNGDIDVKGLTMKNARVTTVSGDITIDAIANNTSNYSFDTVSGDVTLVTTLPPTGASLGYRAVSGSSKINGDWTAATGRRKWQLAAGTDGPEIHVKAVSGDLKATAKADPTVTLTKEEIPRSAAADADQDTSATEGNGQSNSRQDDAPFSADVDWDKARDWVKEMTQRISRVVNDMDEAGERRRQGSASSANEMEPIRTDASGSRAETQPFVTPPTPPTPPVHPHGSAPTEPVSPRQPDAGETAPIPPSPAASSSGETPEARRLRLLQAVQRGEMTVDDALAQMDGDESRS